MINVRIKKKGAKTGRMLPKRLWLKWKKELESKGPRGLACIWYRACRACDGGSQAGELGEKGAEKLPPPFKVKSNSVFDVE